jgi:hypothetical protein
MIIDLDDALYLYYWAKSSLENFLTTAAAGVRAIAGAGAPVDMRFARFEYNAATYDSRHPETADPRLASGLLLHAFATTLKLRLERLLIIERRIEEANEESKGRLKAEIQANLRSTIFIISVYLLTRWLHIRRAIYDNATGAVEDQSQTLVVAVPGAGGEPVKSAQLEIFNEEERIAINTLLIKYWDRFSAVMGGEDNIIFVKPSGAIDGSSPIQTTTPIIKESFFSSKPAMFKKEGDEWVDKGAEQLDELEKIIKGLCVDMKDPVITAQLDGRRSEYGSAKVRKIEGNMPIGAMANPLLRHLFENAGLAPADGHRSAYLPSPASSAAPSAAVSRAASGASIRANVGANANARHIAAAVALSSLSGVAHEHPAGELVRLPAAVGDKRRRGGEAASGGAAAPSGGAGGAAAAPSGGAGHAGGGRRLKKQTKKRSKKNSKKNNKKSRRSRR